MRFQRSDACYARARVIGVNFIVMNLILERTEQVKFYTYLPLVFEALKIDCEEYNWYLSDVETNGFSFEDGWYSGLDLKNQIENNHIQFIWAVLSAFEPNVRFEVTNPPYIYDNPNYWNGTDPDTQLEGAQFEIGCWDSGATILIGLNEELENNFRTKYSDTKLLKDVAR